MLVFVGCKMTFLNRLFGGHFPITWSLGIILGVIGVSVVVSLLFPRHHEPGEPLLPPLPLPPTADLMMEDDDERRERLAAGKGEKVDK